MLDVPVLDGVDDVRVVQVPMRVRFRGVLHREAVLLHGPAGWGEFAPFLEYADEEASRWLAAALESCTSPWPDPVRPSVPEGAPAEIAMATIRPHLAARRLRRPGQRTRRVRGHPTAARGAAGSRR